MFLWDQFANASDIYGIGVGFYFFWNQEVVLDSVRHEDAIETVFLKQFLLGSVVNDDLLGLVEHQEHPFHGVVLEV